jgi:hypothetical protein
MKEKTRQKHFINLIPSENFTSQAVLEALGSPMQSMFAVCFHSLCTGNRVPTNDIFHIRQVLGRISWCSLLRRQ